MTDGYYYNHMDTDAWGPGTVVHESMEGRIREDLIKD